MSPTLRVNPTLDKALRRCCVWAISFYQRFLSPLLGGQCRFYPSCSQYAKEAFERRSFFTAIWLTAKRLVKCQPFHPGGYDPLDPDDPQKFSEENATGTKQ